MYLQIQQCYSGEEEPVLHPGKESVFLRIRKHVVLIDDEKGFVPMQADLLVQHFHYCMFHQNVGRSIKGFHLVLALLTVPGFASMY